MINIRVFVGYCFLVIGAVSAGTSIYMLSDNRLVNLFNTQQNIKVEVILLLIFSVLLIYSGFKTIQKEYRKNKLKQSELLDD